MQFLFTKQPTIGLDIQADAIRFVQLKKKSRQSPVLITHKMPLPPRLFTEGKVNDWQLLTAHLAEFVENLSWQHLPTVISLPTHLVRMQRFSVVAGLSEGEIEADIFLKLEQEMPGLKEPLAIDFSYLSTKAMSEAEVLYTVVREQYLAAYLKCVTAAGLDVKIVEVDCYAIKRALQLDLPILHIKRHGGEFMVFEEQILVFHQYWFAENEEENSLRLKECLQIYSATFRERSGYQLMLLVSEKDQLIYQNLLNELAVAEVLLPKLNLPGEFALAFGLALRECPAW